MQSITDTCFKCKLLKPIQNKTHWLCGDCVFEKNHGGKTREQVYRERHAKKEAKKKELPKEFVEDRDLLIKGLKQAFSIKRIRNKRADIEKELRQVYRKIDHDRPPVCEGCGRSDRPLSHSHLLSRALRPDLICQEDNIKLHCFGNWGGPDKTCHEKWADFIPHEVMGMLDFEDNMLYISEVDVNKFNGLMVKLEQKDRIADYTNSNEN